MKRRSFSKEFKSNPPDRRAEMAIEAFKGIRTINEISAQYQVHPKLFSKCLKSEGSLRESSQQYEKFSCDNYIKNFRTPMLIIHGEKDYRLDFTQGLMVFTALRRVGVPAKLVIFPDEGHWVLKPQNSRFWHRTVFDWLKVY